jgi:hypothetical protein
LVHGIINHQHVHHRRDRSSNMMLRRCLPYLVVLVFSLASYYIVLRFNVIMKMRYSTVTEVVGDSTTTTTKAKNATAAISELETSSAPTETSDQEGFSSSSSSSSLFLPQIVWLASYPNSGTSYTMTMVQRATNLATATTQ